MPEIGTDLYLAYENGYEAGKKDATPQWISVTERLPEDDKAVLTCGPRGGMYIAKAHGHLTDLKYLWWNVAGSSKVIYVTHWMPLPEPPRQRKEGTE